MRKPVKWTLIGLGIFIGVIVVTFLVFFISATICGIKEGIKKTFTTETRQIEQAKETETTEEIPKAEKKETTATQLESSKLEPGQGFIYNGVKIALTKYEIEPADWTDKNILWVYLYVENIDNVPHNHIYGDMDFKLYHNGREDGYLGSFNLAGRKNYDTGPYSKLYPGETCEGWLNEFIPTDWKAEDIEIHFKPFLSGTICIWKLE